ncbi:DUF6323 family protein [Acetobacterium wieringae]|uniref:Uncharacterized protein n=1 Tax=Acetobacterium wieringae TaxID=52694 RepID=A0A1F2PIC3_9FIRM|nr:DUF6323 family protein [Acetobacterium wieringae]OFV71070.1 hypothetical protein ACWI_16560 [Acetobacterium wieringae]
MSFELMLFDNFLIEKQAVSEVLLCNKITADYALVLSEEQALELVETRSDSLKNVGRVEFGGGIIEKVILTFANSPYISQHYYAEIINDLVEIFYYFKNETLDLMSDDDLIGTMKKYFDGVCQGSLDQLKFRELERVARNVRLGIDPDYNDLYDSEKLMEDEDEDE